MNRLKKHGVKIFIVTVLIVSALFLGIFWWHFHNQGFSQEIEDWGSFGNYLGSLAAVFGFATFVLLLWNLRLSQNQFKDTRNHDEILLLYKVVKTCTGEIDKLLGMTDQIGEYFYEGIFEPIAFPLIRLRDKGIIITEEDIRDEPSLAELFPPGARLADVGEICLTCKVRWSGTEGEEFSWYRHLVLTDSPFIQLLERLSEFNRLLGSITTLSPKSPLPDHFKRRFANVFFVLVQSQYLKIDEAKSVLDSEDRNLVVNYFTGYERMVDPETQFDLAVDQLRIGIQPELTFGRKYYATIPDPKHSWVEK